MNVLVVHNFYQQAGGEDGVFADECALLRDRGHHVVTYTVHNDSVAQLGKLSLARKTIWNQESYDSIAQIVRKERIDIAHFHNTFPLVSPAGYYAARDNGARVVQTLHNYRLMCPVATFFRDGHVCEECLGRAVPWPGVVHACYRDNRPASAVTAAMLAGHRAKGTYRDAVDLYLPLTQFARNKFVQAGFPERKLFVKPNFVSPDPGEGAGGGGYVLFIGRLSEEKGLSVLLKAAELLSGRIALKILGDGPLRQQVEGAAARVAGVEYLGRRPSNQVYDILAGAEALVFPSVWYEGLPRTIIEAFAKGTPVVASRLGSMAELVQPGRTGRLFDPGDPADLARHVREILDNPTELSELRSRARAEFLRAYTAERNYPMLIEAYRLALQN
jgi:glycosyltransferase involved in cell wall biosynthesis